MTHGSLPLSVGLANDHNGVAGTSNAVPSNLPAESWMTRLVNPVTRGDYGEGSKEGLLNILLHFSFLAPRSSLGFSLFPRGGARGRFFFQKVFRERRNNNCIWIEYSPSIFIWKYACIPFCNAIEIGVRVWKNKINNLLLRMIIERGMIVYFSYKNR